MDPLDLLDEDNAKVVTGLEYSRRKKVKQEDNNFKSLLSQTLNKSFKSENEGDSKNENTNTKASENKSKETGGSEYIPSFLNNNSRSRPPKDKEENQLKTNENLNSAVPTFELNSRRRKVNTVILADTKPNVEIKEQEVKQTLNKNEIIDEDEPYIPTKTNVRLNIYLRMLIL